MSPEHRFPKLMIYPCQDLPVYPSLNAESYDRATRGTSFATSSNPMRLYPYPN
jgi:hypothetical protein